MRYLLYNPLSGEENHPRSTAECFEVLAYQPVKLTAITEIADPGFSLRRRCYLWRRRNSQSGRERAVRFPSIFKGKHVKKKKNVTILQGKNITVTFDRPTPLQIDGETVLDVMTYNVTV